MEYVNNFAKHLNKVITHKKYVSYYCSEFGIPVQGLFHDLSKFSPIEFFESVKYYQGDKSPIDACKKANGWSMAWMHHKGRNPHHYEFWMDNFDHGGTPLIMPPKYAIELICDYLGAGRAYMGNKFTYTAEFEWWLTKKANGLAMHPMMIEFVDAVLGTLASMEIQYKNPEYKITNNDVAFVYSCYLDLLKKYLPESVIKNNKFWKKEIENLNKTILKYSKKP